MIREEIGRVRPGQVYRYHGPRATVTDETTVVSPSASPQDLPGDRYRCLRLAWDVHTRRQVVAYEGLDGRDRGVWFVCSVYDFALKFRPEESPAAPGQPPAPAADPVPERPAGRLESPLTL